MATASKKPKYQPDAEYDVRLARVVRYGGLKLLPRNACVLTGAALNEIVEREGEDVIDAATSR
ncbi:hypothetical protein AB4099_05540 [Bosea sp. 2KB_26]|uniref:hypothetical protein n=1 Tax=Bosea sp. 2KB_26 TaxID=3237475 RepID=UPI003F8E1A29